MKLNTSTDQRHKAINMPWQGRQLEANSEHLCSDQVNLPGSETIILEIDE